MELFCDALKNEWMGDLLARHSRRLDNIEFDNLIGVELWHIDVTRIADRQRVRIRQAFCERASTSAIHIHNEDLWLQLTALIVAGDADEKVF